MTADLKARLTAKEKTFASAIAGGATLWVAYQRAYSDRASRSVADANARKVLRRPKVAAAIEEMRRHPQPDNFEGVREFAFELLIQIAEGDPDPVVRHRAIKTLLAHAEKGLRRSPPPQPTVSVPDKKVNREQIIAELRAIYQRELGAPTKVPPQANLLLVDAAAADLSPDVGETRAVASGGVPHKVCSPGPNDDGSVQAQVLRLRGERR
jgi:hypothetical protein